MSTTGKIATALVAAGAALGGVAVLESPGGRRAVTDFLDESGVLDSLQGVAEKFAVHLVRTVFSGATSTISTT